jgi:hypothetical protein
VSAVIYPSIPRLNFEPHSDAVTDFMMRWLPGEGDEGLLQDRMKSAKL